LGLILIDGDLLLNHNGLIISTLLFDWDPETGLWVNNKQDRKKNDSYLTRIWKEVLKD
jgi:hypothetical protein